MNGVNQVPLSAGIIWGSAFQTKSSCTMVGTARKTQTYPQARARMTL